MKNMILTLFLVAIQLLMGGCERSSQRDALKEIYKQKPDTDVSSSVYYNFSSFTNTVWKTRVKIPLADTEHYTGRHIEILVGPQTFDSGHPTYNQLLNMRLIKWVPEGSYVRIERLMEDNGPWGGVSVVATIDDSRNVYVNNMLLSTNRFISGWRCTSTNWDVNHDFLEPAIK